MVLICDCAHAAEFAADASSRQTHAFIDPPYYRVLVFNIPAFQDFIFLVTKRARLAALRQSGASKTSAKKHDETKGKGKDTLAIRAFRAVLVQLAGDA